FSGKREAARGVRPARQHAGGRRGPAGGLRAGQRLHAGARGRGAAHHRHVDEEHAAGGAPAPTAAGGRGNVAGKSRMIRIGLTGGLASGKSTVAGMLRDRGIAVVDADEIAKRILHGQARATVVAEFGAGILAGDGTAIAPEKLAAEVFAPGGEAKLAAVEAALLLEAGAAAGFDKLVVVTAPQEVRVRRFIERTGASRQHALQRMA